MMRPTLPSALLNARLRVSLALSLCGALMTLTTGCASVAAMQEDTSLELALERVEAIEKNSQWGERLLTRTKVGAEDWPGELHLINDQHIIAVTPGMGRRLA